MTVSESRLVFLAVPAFLIAAAVLVLVSIPALHGPLMLDSVKLHRLVDVIRDHGNLAVLHTPAFGRVFGRILSMASFVLNLQAAGELSIFQVKLTNLLIHTATGIPVFILTRLIAQTTPFASRATTLAIGTALLWLLSPVNYNVALYAIQRMAQLSALFVFLGLASYVAGRLQEQALWRRLYLALSLLCLPLAVLSKENGALLVALAFLVEVYFLHPVRPWLTGRQLAIIVVVGVVTAVVLLFYLYPGALNYHSRDFTLSERLLSQPRALLDYLRHIVLPFGGDTGLYTDDFQASPSVLHPWTTMPALFACIIMLVFCVACRGGRLALPAFGLAFFFAGHLVESTFLPLELYFLHRNYLPSYGIYLALAWLAVAILPVRRWTVLALAVYAAYFTTIDHARALTWADRGRIIATAVHFHPDSPRALSSYAQVALDRGDLPTAIAASNKVIDLDDALSPRVQRLFILCHAGAPIRDQEYESLRQIRRFGVGNEISQALGNLLTLYERGGCGRLDIDALVASLDHLVDRYAERRGNPWVIAYYADMFLYASGQRAAAHRRLQHRVEAGYPAPGMLNIELLISEGERDEAAEMLDRIVARFPADRLRRYEQALEDFRRRLGK